MSYCKLYSLNSDTLVSRDVNTCLHCGVRRSLVRHHPSGVLLCSKCSVDALEGRTHCGGREGWRARCCCAWSC